MVEVAEKGRTENSPRRLTPDQFETLAAVLNLVRTGNGSTRSEIARRSSLGRTIVAERVGQLLGLGLLETSGFSPSTGGRASARLRFRAERGAVLVAMFGASSLSAGIADLSGALLVWTEQAFDVAAGPETSLTELERVFRRLMVTESIALADLWGVGISLPGPVEFATGRPSAPPIMPGWDGYPVRERLEKRFGVTTWVDNDVNALTLGELRAGLGKGERDMVYVKIGTGIGAGLVSGGSLHRGANGCAGDIGHTAAVEDGSAVCRCGKRGCLEALAGGAAIARDGRTLAQEGKSTLLGEILASTGAVTAKDVATAASAGDSAALSVLTNAGRLIGETLATLVSFFNPTLVVLGGGVAGAGDNLLATVRETVYRRSLPLATRDLRIALTTLRNQAGLIGGAFMVIDDLFSAVGLQQWIASEAPRGLLLRTEQTAVTT